MVQSRGCQHVTVPGAPCPFCDRVESGVVFASGEHAVAFTDAFPLNPGHTLVVPRSHVDGLFSLPAPEVEGVWRLVAEVRGSLAREHRPDGFTIGVNDGIAAGQTVAHAHVHVIPRSAGDVDDPRGGIRWVVPARARYWST